MKWALNDTDWARHPSDPRLDGIYGTILVDDLGQHADGPHQRNVTVFADGEVDRSPCGSGTSARLALLAADGRLGAGQVLRHDSIIGTTFLGRVVAEVAGRGPARGDHRDRGDGLPDRHGDVQPRPGRSARHRIPAALTTEIRRR